MGAWIEMRDCIPSGAGGMSLPPWERGLKCMGINPVTGYAYVAPPVGAWIEIDQRGRYSGGRGVAPPVGAWIEICCSVISGIGLPGRSPRGSVD